MVGKLIKHEIVRTRGLVLTIFGAATLLVLVGAGTAWLGWPLFAQLGLIIAVLGSFGLIPATQLLLAVDYWRSSYRGTGYLTHSLPVKGSVIYWAKFIWAAIVSVAAVVWTVVLAPFTASAMAGITPLEALREMNAAVRQAVAVIPGWTIAPLVLLILLALFLPVVQYFFAGSIGSEKRLNQLGIGGPVIVFFLLYIALQLFTTIFLFAVPLGLYVDGFGPELVQANFWRMVANNDNSNVIPLGFIPAFVVAAVLLVWRTLVSWNKKVSLA